MRNCFSRIEKPCGTLQSVFRAWEGAQV